MNGTKGQEKQRIRHVLYYQTQANTRKRNHRGMNDNPKKQMGIKERRKRKPDTRETCEGKYLPQSFSDLLLILCPFLSRTLFKNHRSFQ